MLFTRARPTISPTSDARSPLAPSAKFRVVLQGMAVDMFRYFEIVGHRHPGSAFSSVMSINGASLTNHEAKNGRKLLCSVQHRPRCRASMMMGICYDRWQKAIGAALDTGKPQTETPTCTYAGMEMYSMLHADWRH